MDPARDDDADNNDRNHEDEDEDEDEDMLPLVRGTPSSSSSEEQGHDVASHEDQDPQTICPTQPLP